MGKNTESTFTIKAIDRTQKVLDGVKRSLKAVSVAAVATVAAAATAIAGVTAKGLENVDMLAKAAGRLDLGVAQYQALNHAAAKADVSVGDLESAFGKMRREIGELDPVFAELGLNMEDLLRMDANQQFSAIAEALNQIENPTLRAAKAQEIFGRSAQKLQNLLRDGGAAIAINEKLYQDLGIALSETDAVMVEMANDSMADLKQIGDGVANTFAVQFAPAITAVTEALIGAGSGGGLGNAVENVSRFIVDGLVTAIAVAADAWHNLKTFVKAGEVGLLAFAKVQSTVFTGLVKGTASLIETVVNAVLDGINSAIRKVNEAIGKLPNWLRKHLDGVSEIPEIKFRLKLDTSGFTGFDSALGGALDQARQEGLALLNAPLPSDGIISGFNNSIFDIQQRAQETAAQKGQFQDSSVIDDAEVIRDRIKEVEDEILQNSEEFVTARNATLVEGTQTAFDGLLGLTQQFAGEQSGLYKGMFAASKAFAMAQSVVSITQGIANAAALPFPANLAAMGTVVGATAGLISTIASTALSFEGGGHTGNGPRAGGLDGKGGFMAMLHPKERVIDEHQGQGQSVKIVVNNYSDSQASVRRRGPNEFEVIIKAVENYLVAGEESGAGRLSKSIRRNNGLQRSGA